MKKIIVFISAIIIAISSLTVTSYAITEYVGKHSYDYTTWAVVTARTNGVERAKFYYYPGNGRTHQCIYMQTVMVMQHLQQQQLILLRYTNIGEVKVLWRAGIIVQQLRLQVKDMQSHYIIMRI